MIEKIKKHKKLTIVIVILLIVAIVGGIIFAKTKASSGTDVVYTSGAQAFYLSKQDMTTTVSTSGKVESKNASEVTTEVSSSIETLNVSLGDHVEEGDVLCTFNGDEIRQQISDLEKQNASAKKTNDNTIAKAKRAVDTAQANVNAKATALTNAQNNYNTIKSILDNEGTTENADALAQAQANLMTAQSDYDAANQELISATDVYNEAKDTTVDTGTELTKLYQQLNNLTVTAPQSGIITQLNVSKGSIPSNGSLMRIEDDSDLIVNVNIKEKDILKISEGQSVSITSDAIGSDQVFKGTVEKVVNFAAASSDTTSSSSSSYSATVALEAGTPLLLGMSVNVEIVLNDEGESLAVPYDAIAVDEDDSSYVFVCDAADDGKYQIRKVTVTTGTSNAYYTAITSDELSEGDLIINYPSEVTEGETTEVYIPEDQVLSGDTDGTFTDSSVAY